MECKNFIKEFLNIEEFDKFYIEKFYISGRNGETNQTNQTNQTRPRGRAPKGKIWNDLLGKYIQEPKGIFPRPRGRCPKNKKWDGMKGKWVKK